METFLNVAMCVHALPHPSGMSGQEAVLSATHAGACAGGGAAPTSFDGLELTDGTRKGVEHMGFTKMMEIQARCIPLLLSGKDVVGQAKTGYARPEPTPTTGRTASP